MEEIIASQIIHFVKNYSYTEFVKTIKNIFVWRQVIVPFLREYHLPDGMRADIVEGCYADTPFKDGILGAFVSFRDYKLCLEDIMSALYISNNNAYVREYREGFEEISYYLILQLREKSKTNWLVESFLGFYNQGDDSMQLEYSEKELDLMYQDPVRAYEHYYHALSFFKYGETVRVYYPSQGYVDYAHYLEVKVPRDKAAPSGFFLTQCDYALELNGSKTEWVKCVRSTERSCVFITDMREDDEKIGEIVWLR